MTILIGLTIQHLWS